MTPNYSKETEHVFKMIRRFAPGPELYKYLQKNKTQIDFEEIETWGSYNVLNSFCYQIDNYSANDALSILDFLIENTIYIDQMDSDGTTALINIIRKSPKEILEKAIEKLLGAGANVNKYQGETALMWAANCIQEENIFKKILYLSDDEVFFAISNREDYKEGALRKANAAHYAATSGNINNLKLLIEENIDMSQENENKNTPLQTLVARDKETTALELIKEYPALLGIEMQSLSDKRYPKIDNFFVYEQDVLAQKSWAQTVKILAEQDKLQKSLRSTEKLSKKLATQKI